MFSKVALLALVTPLVAGITLQVPANPTSSETITISWTSAATDPTTFTLELVNTAFHNSFAIANNVQTADGQITLELPSVPVGAGYTLEAVDIGNINNVYDTTAPFSIGPNAASTGVTTATTPSTATTGAATATSPVTVVTPTGTATTGFGTTVSNTLTTPTTTSGTGTSTTSHPTTSSAAMAPLKINSNIGAFAAVLFSAIAGAAVVAL